MPITVHSIIVAAHLSSVALGLGAALIADAAAFGFLRGLAVSDSDIVRINGLSKWVSVGVVFIWITGAVLIWDNWSLNAASVANQKLWAKLVIVALLTINARVLHRFILPYLPKQLGFGLFDSMHPWLRVSFTLSAAVSIVSWFFALVLGVARELNGVASVMNVLAAYFLAVAFAWLLTTLISILLPTIEIQGRNRLARIRLTLRLKPAQDV